MITYEKMDVDSLADMQACFVHVKCVSPVPIMMYAYYDFKKCLFLCQETSQ